MAQTLDFRLERGRLTATLDDSPIALGAAFTLAAEIQREQLKARLQKSGHVRLTRAEEEGVPPPESPPRRKSEPGA